MTPKLAKLAMKLYKSYKTDTMAYYELAKSLGMNTAELNSRCWHILHDQRQEAERQRKAR